MLFEPFRLYTEYSFINTESANQNKSSAFCRLHKCFQTFLKKSVDPDQTAPASSLIWGLHRLHLHLRNLINNISRFKYYGGVMGQDDAVTCN